MQSGRGCACYTSWGGGLKTAGESEGHGDPARRGLQVCRGPLSQWVSESLRQGLLRGPRSAALGRCPVYPTCATAPPPPSFSTGGRESRRFRSLPCSLLCCKKQKPPRPASSQEEDLSFPVAAKLERGTRTPNSTDTCPPPSAPPSLTPRPPVPTPHGCPGLLS